jgi:deoxycytidylate deaminase
MNNQKDYFKYAMWTSALSGCLKLQVGAAIIKNGELLGVGYNDANPIEPYCPRKDMPSGTGYFLCSTHCSQQHHAETMAINAVLHSKKSHLLQGSDIYIYGHNQVCSQCETAMRHYGINKVYLMKHNDNNLECFEFSL